MVVSGPLGVFSIRFLKAVENNSSNRNSSLPWLGDDEVNFKPSVACATVVTGFVMTTATGPLIAISARIGPAPPSSDGFARIFVMRKVRVPPVTYGTPVQTMVLSAKPVA